MKKQIYTLNGRGKGSLNDLVAEELYLLVDTASTAAIPLGGTADGSPVTGPIVTQAVSAFVSESQLRIGSSPIKDLEQALSAYFVSLISGEIAAAGINASNSTKQGAITVEIDFSEPGVRVFVNLPSDSKGMVGSYDFSANYVPFSFIQKTYVDTVIQTPIAQISDTTVALSTTTQTKYYAILTENSLCSLPPIAGYVGKAFFIVNKSIGDIELFSNDGVSTDIWDSGVLKSQTTLFQGETFQLFNDGVNWVIIA